MHPGVVKQNLVYTTVRVLLMTLFGKRLNRYSLPVNGQRGAMNCWCSVKMGL